MPCLYDLEVNGHAMCPRTSKSVHRFRAQRGLESTPKESLELQMISNSSLPFQGKDSVLQMIPEPKPPKVYEFNAINGPFERSTTGANPLLSAVSKLPTDRLFFYRMYDHFVDPQTGRLQEVDKQPTGKCSLLLPNGGTLPFFGVIVTPH